MANRVKIPNKVWAAGQLGVWLILVLSAQGCRFRNTEPLDDATFKVHADAGCYTYNRDSLFLGGRLTVVQCNTGSSWLPGLMINQTCVLFSIENPEVVDLVKHSFQDDKTFGRFLSCSQGAAHCCNTTLRRESSAQDHCPPVWDGWSCYDYTEPGTTSEQLCPLFAYSSLRPPKCGHYSYKQCHADGTWNDNTDYSTCSVTPRLLARTRWHIAILSISIIFCLPAFFIFWKYGSLKLQKFYLIILLIVALIVRNLFVILSKAIVVMDELTNPGDDTIMTRNGAACRLLAFFEKLAANFVFTCILLLGVFLHQLLTNVFVARKNSVPNMKWFYIGGSGVAILSALVWAIVIAVKSNEHCWMIMDEKNYQWIYDAPRLLMLLLSAGLMVHIIVRLWQTFRYRPNEQHVAIRTARVSLYCAPIFALHFFFVLIRPNTESCAWEQVYYIVVYFVEGMQGILVALLQFYTDREVVRVLKLSYDRLTFAFNHRFSVYRTRRSATSASTERVTVSAISDPKIEAGLRKRSAPDIVPLDVEPKVESEWDPSLSDLHVSLVSIDFGEDDDIFYDDDSEVAQDIRRRTTEAVISEVDEAPEEVQEQPKNDTGSRKRSEKEVFDIHPKHFMKDRAKGIVFLEETAEKM